MTTRGEEISALLLRVRAGDQHAVTELVRCYAPWLRALAQRQLSPAQQGVYRTSELAQESLIKMGVNLPKFSGVTQQELEAWLRTILTHTLITHWRFATAERRNRLHNDPLDKVSVLPADEPSAVDDLIAAQERRTLLEALARLPDAQREAVWLHHVEGLKVEEVAVELGRTRWSAAGLIRRGLRALRQQCASLVKAERGPVQDPLDGES